MKFHSNVFIESFSISLIYALHPTHLYLHPSILTKWPILFINKYTIAQLIQGDLLKLYRKEGNETENENNYDIVFA